MARADLENLESMELRSRLRVISRHRLMVVVIVVIGFSGSLIASLSQSPLYEAEVRVLLQARDSESLFDRVTDNRPDPVRRVETEIELVKSEAVRTEVRRRFPEAPKPTVSAVGDTDIIAIKTETGDRRQAGDIAVDYARAYIEFRKQEAIGDVQAAGRNLEVKLGDLRRQVEGVEAQILAISPRQPEPTGLIAARDQLLRQEALFKQRLDELQVEVELKTGGAQLVTQSRPPTEKVRPRPIAAGAIGLVLSVVAALGLAFLRESLDDSIKSKTELDRVLPNLPVLGLVTKIDYWKNRTTPLLVTLTEPSSPAAESYRSLRTSLHFIASQGERTVFQLTSANAGEGKTSTLANLSVVLAGAGQRVAIIDCDLRSPRLHKFFGVSNRSGVTSILVDDLTPAQTIQSIPDIPNLELIASGPTPPNPSELLSSRRMSQLLTWLKQEYDVVLIDCPPVLPVADAVALSGLVDGTVLVVRAGFTARAALERTVEVLLQNEAPLVGSVLNGMAQVDGYGYYSYRYGQEDEPRRRSSGDTRRRSAGRPSDEHTESPVDPQDGFFDTGTTNGNGSITVGADGKVERAADGS